jgi:hypothetical protein
MLCLLGDHEQGGAGAVGSLRAGRDVPAPMRPGTRSVPGWRWARGGRPRGRFRAGTRFPWSGIWGRLRLPGASRCAGSPGDAATVTGRGWPCGQGVRAVAGCPPLVPLSSSGCP